MADIIRSLNSVSGYKCTTYNGKATQVVNSNNSKIPLDSLPEIYSTQQNKTLWASIYSNTPCNAHYKYDNCSSNQKITNGWTIIQSQCQNNLQQNNLTYTENDVKFKSGLILKTLENDIKDIYSILTTIISARQRHNKYKYNAAPFAEIPKKQAADTLIKTNYLMELNNSLKQYFNIERNTKRFKELALYTNNVIDSKQINDTFISNLMTLGNECVCYSDCTGYSICWCYGNCNHY